MANLAFGAIREAGVTSFMTGLVGMLVLVALVWFCERRARMRFEAQLDPNQGAALRSHLELGRSWRDFRRELDHARSRVAAERETLRTVADERFEAIRPRAS
jgi:hypothetical protein